MVSHMSPASRGSSLRVSGQARMAATLAGNLSTKADLRATVSKIEEEERVAAVALFERMHQRSAEAEVAAEPRRRQFEPSSPARGRAGMIRGMRPMTSWLNHLSFTEGCSAAVAAAAEGPSPSRPASARLAPRSAGEAQQRALNEHYEVAAETFRQEAIRSVEERKAARLRAYAVGLLRDAPEGSSTRGSTSLDNVGAPPTAPPCTARPDLSPSTPRRVSSPRDHVPTWPSSPTIKPTIKPTIRPTIASTPSTPTYRSAPTRAAVSAPQYQRLNLRPPSLEVHSPCQSEPSPPSVALKAGGADARGGTISSSIGASAATLTASTPRAGAAPPGSSPPSPTARSSPPLRAESPRWWRMPPSAIAGADEFDARHQRLQTAASNELATLGTTAQRQTAAARGFHSSVGEVFRNRYVNKDTRRQVVRLPPRKRTLPRSQLWSLARSIWQRRPAYSASRAFVDTPELKVRRAVGWSSDGPSDAL